MAAALLSGTAAGAGPQTEFDRFLGAAMELHRSLEYERALDQLSRARAKAKSVEESKKVALYEGVVRADMGDWEQARAAFRTALLLDPAIALPPKVSPKVEREFEQVRFEVRRKLALAPPAEAPEGQTRTGLRLWAWLPAAVGALGLAGGGYSLVQSEERYRRLGTSPSMGIRESELMRDEGGGFQTLGWVGVGVGAAGLSAAAALFLAGQPAAEEGPLSIFVAPTPQGAALCISGAVP